MERDVNSYMQRGADKADLVAGLAYSIVYNYINRVVRGRTIGDCIFFQGGTAYNDSVAAAFAAVTGKQIIVPPHNGVIGAIGVALLARDKMNAVAEGLLTVEPAEKADPKRGTYISALEPDDATADQHFVNRPPPGSPEAHSLALFDLKPPVSIADIKDRYKALVKRHHPDANGGDKGAEEKFKQVSQAYQILMAEISD